MRSGPFVTAVLQRRRVLCWRDVGLGSVLHLQGSGSVLEGDGEGREDRFFEEVFEPFARAMKAKLMLVVTRTHTHAHI